MDLVNRRAVVYVTSDGFSQLAHLLGLQDQSDGLVAHVAEADSFGVWLATAEERSVRIVIVPWRLIRAFEIEPEPGAAEEEKKEIGFHT